MRVAVIGLGVIGAATARSLALAGAEVTVFERQAPGSGTSRTSFAWTNNHQKDPRAYHDIHVAGIAEYETLAPDGGDWYFRTGNLEWARPDDQARLAESVDELVRRGFAAEWVTPGRARELVPDLVVPADVRDVAWYPDEGYVLPVPLVGRLWGEALDHGARLRCPAEVVGVRENGAVVVVDLADQESERFDTVVLAAGRWSEALAATAGAVVPVADPDLATSATVGLLAYTEPVSARVNRVLTTPEINVRPDGGGRLVLQGLDLDVLGDPAVPPSPHDAPGRELCRRLITVVRGAEDVVLSSLRVGQRAIPADGLPITGYAGERVYVIATHSGISLAPLLGRLAAQEVVDGRRSDLLATFRPQRFDGVDPASLPPLPAKRFAGQR